jgi:septal ring factor EnvC (AmiA/AmiB activator)
LAREKQKDSLNFVISQREVQNTFLKEENSHLRGNIQNIKNRPVKAPKGLENLTQYFNERYITKDNVVINDKVGLDVYTAMDVTSDLEEFDKVIEIVNVQDSIMTNNNLVINNLEKDKSNLKTQIKSAENLLEEHKELNDFAEKNIENLQKQVKSGKRKNFWNKVLIVTSGVGGFIIGKNLTK